MAINRFWYTAPSTSQVIHRCYARARVEGALTACGRRAKKGWFWWAGKGGMDPPRRMCNQCRASNGR